MSWSRCEVYLFKIERYLWDAKLVAADADLAGRKRGQPRKSVAAAR
jgi:hypothetical protein